MTIIEAIKSGKPFRRKGWDEWAYVAKHDTLIYGRRSLPLGSGDILADDWEIQVTYYPITEEEIGHIIENTRLANLTGAATVTVLLQHIRARGPVKVGEE